MVLSLADIALLSISNGIKDGTIQNPHMLPPKLRQRVLDTVLKRRLINNPNCLALLCSVEFLNGMVSFSTEAGREEDFDFLQDFLQRVINSMGAILSNGQTVGDAIKKLNVNVFGSKCIMGEDFVKNSTFPMVSQLINQCPNTTSLALNGINSVRCEHCHGESASGHNAPWFPSILNEGNGCSEVMENLVELSISNWDCSAKILGGKHPIINFKQLTILKLNLCCVQADVWPEFIRNIPNVVDLQMIDVKNVGEEDSDGEYIQVDAKGLDWILPMSMPHLKSLVVVNNMWNDSAFECNSAFVDNLMGCKEIRNVHLTLDHKSADETSLVRLANMDICLKIGVRFDVDGNNTIENKALFDSSSRFKIIRIFQENLDSFKLAVRSEWGPQFSTALEDVIDSCFNLREFRIFLPCPHMIPAATAIEWQEMNRINTSLLRLFDTWERALQLEDLRLAGDFDEAVIEAVFARCLNLVRLRTVHCPALRDQHLIDWVSRGGGKLTQFGVCKCDNVTIEGIIPILIKSGNGLSCIHVHLIGTDDERDWETMWRSYCPYARYLP